MDISCAGPPPPASSLRVTHASSNSRGFIAIMAGASVTAVTGTTVVGAAAAAGSVRAELMVAHPITRLVVLMQRETMEDHSASSGRVEINCGWVVTRIHGGFAAMCVLLIDSKYLGDTLYRLSLFKPTWYLRIDGYWDGGGHMHTMAAITICA